MSRRHLVSALIVLTLAAACGGGSSSTPTPTSPTPPPPPAQTNRSPVIGSMSMGPAFGVSELTTFTYSASASDPDGDTVSYAWDLAGTPRSGASGQITFSGSGLAEALKHGIIADERHFEAMVAAAPALSDEGWMPDDAFVAQLARSIAIKADVVRQDPREHGLRNKSK